MSFQSQLLPARNMWSTTHYDDEVIDLKSRIGQRRFQDKPIAFYGSSSFRLWHRMAEDLNCLEIANLGFGGGTMESAMRYLDDVLSCVTPKSFVLYFGENDIANDGLTAETIIQMYLALKARIRESLGDIPIYYLSTKHSPARWIYKDEVNKLNDLAKKACEQDAACVYVDCTSCLLGANGLPVWRFYQPDSLHLNHEGYGRWAESLAEAPGLFTR